MPLRYGILILFVVIVGAGVVLVKSIDITPYTRGEISTYVYWQKNPTIKMLQQSIRDGDNVNEYSEYGWTPIMFAIQTGDADMVRALAAAGADVNAIAEDSSTPLIQAVITARTPHMIEILLELGADTSVRDRNNRTAADYASENTHLNRTDVVDKLAP